MLRPKRSITTKYDTVQLTEEQKPFYRWISFRQNEKLTPDQLNGIIEPHQLTDEELKFYVKLDKTLQIPHHWGIISALAKTHKEANSDNVVDDSLEFLLDFRLMSSGGRLHRKKLYALYYEWSELPMSREKFYSIFNKRFWPIPKESAMINAFIVTRRNRQTAERMRAIRKREELAKIMYGRDEKAVKKALWNFW